MSKNQQIRLLRQCAKLLAANKTCNESSLVKWTKIVFFAHNHGFLYCGFDQKGKIDLACIAYRVTDFEPSDDVMLPDREEGDILHVVAVASKTKDGKKLLRLLKWYLREHPEVSEIAYHHRNSDNHKIFVIRRNHGEEIKSINS